MAKMVFGYMPLKSGLSKKSKGLPSLLNAV